MIILTLTLLHHLYTHNRVCILYSSSFNTNVRICRPPSDPPGNFPHLLRISSSFLSGVFHNLPKRSHFGDLGGLLRGDAPWGYQSQGSSMPLRSTTENLIKVAQGSSLPSSSIQSGLQALLQSPNHVFLRLSDLRCGHGHRPHPHARRAAERSLELPRG